MELLLVLRTLRREGAKKIHVLLTYFAYARQDRPVGEYIGMMASDVLTMLREAGANKISIVDLHNPFIFNTLSDIKTENIATFSLLESIVVENKLQNFVLVSPDMGSVKRVREAQKQLKAKGHANEIAIMDKIRVEAN